VKFNTRLGIVFPKDGDIGTGSDFNYFDADTGEPVEDVTVTQMQANIAPPYSGRIKVLDIRLDIRIVLREDIIDGEAYAVDELIEDGKGGRLLNWAGGEI
jgi:hypothetical protein